MFRFKKKKTEEKPPNKPQPLVEKVDFYIENGYYVFTEVYLKKRGYCCSNGCRHCPYQRAE